ncbi:hypothetical protein KR018_008671, partial [Drosophila ironensis]
TKMARNECSNIDLSASSSDIRFYKAKAASLQLQLLAVGKGFEANQLPDMDEADLQVRLEAVEKINADFDKFQQLAERADLTELASNARIIFAEEYFDVKSKITRALRKVAVDSVLNSTSIRLPGEQTSVARISTRSSRLPEFKLPRFGGAYMEWPGFYAMFNTVVGNNEELSKV